METSERAILHTLLYADIFDYPLSQKELWHFLLTDFFIKNNKKVNINLEKRIFKNHQTITFASGFYFISGRSHIIKIREKRFKESKIKLKIAQRIASYLFRMPTVYLVGISGALAMNNTDKEDDIDLFIITKANSLWTTRLCLLIILSFLGKRRRRTEKDKSNKICLNMLIDEDSLSLPKDRHDLYTAHEVVQMKPLFERNNTYKKFINANNWVFRFLPNAIKGQSSTKITRNNADKNLSVVQRHSQTCQPRLTRRLVLRLSALEYLAKKLQLWYMKKHITLETITDKMLAFHPVDHGKLVMEEYKKRLKKCDPIFTI